MKGYGAYLQRCQNPAYADRYLDYGRLKSELRRFYERRRELSELLRSEDHGGPGRITVDAFRALNPNGGSGAASSGTTDDPADGGGYLRCVCGDGGGGGDDGRRQLLDREDASLRLSIAERTAFGALLDEQLSDAAAFYGATLMPRVRTLADEKAYDAAAGELLEAVAFACVNAITFRQLLVRYDAFRRAFDGMALDEWRPSRGGRSGAPDDDADHHPARGLFALEGVEELEERIVAGMGTGAAGVGGRGEGGALDAEEFAAQVRTFAYLLDKTHNSLDEAVRGHLVFNDRVLALGTKMKRYLLFGFQSRGLLAEPNSVSMRGRHFKKELNVIAKWRDTRSFAHFSLEEDRRGTFRQNLKDLDSENVLPLFLNLVACFLYMMNNYVIEPSSAYYAEALGSSDALSGLLLGAGPWFALTSSVAYSYWTNYNYKQPILFAGTLQMVGNLMYANAYGYSSMGMCLAGRAVTGLGALRIINRRYVADATPFSLRTAASAAFAMATALGAALGPGVAILLNRMNEFEFYLPLLNKQYFNGMTAPGYFMALSWFIYTMCIVFFFDEPTRSGLEELRQREGSDGPAATDSKRESLLDEVELAAISRDESKATGYLKGASPFHSALETQDSLDGGESDNDGSTDEYVEIASSETEKGYSYYLCPISKNMTRPVIICMSLIFMKRIALESIVGSTSVITKNRYGWDIENVGTLHLVNGMIVIPVSFFSGYLSTLYQDRLMAIWFLAITLFGMAFLFDPTDLVNHKNNATYNEDQLMAVGPVRYVAGSLIAFSGIEACESYVASLMSKVVPSALAQSTWNSGLLATLVGTGGRATGDIFITLMGLISIRNLLNLLIIPGASLTGFSILLILWNYDLLAV